MLIFFFFFWQRVFGRGRGRPLQSRNIMNKLLLAGTQLTSGSRANYQWWEQTDPATSQSPHYPIVW